MLLMVALALLSLFEPLFVQKMFGENAESYIDGEPHCIYYHVTGVLTVLYLAFMIFFSFTAGKRYEPPSIQEMKAIECDANGTLMLIPAYREPDYLLLRSLISSALQVFPTNPGVMREVVVLIDDPPGPSPSIKIVEGIDTRLCIGVECDL